jgi:hypothetical protein
MAEPGQGLLYIMYIIGASKNAGVAVSSESHVPAGKIGPDRLPRHIVGERK